MNVKGKGRKQKSLSFKRERQTIKLLEYSSITAAKVVTFNERSKVCYHFFIAI